MASKPLVAVVGRPNVGKSTLFNKLVGARMAIVEDTPGVTRDRIYADVEWLGHSFTLIDTGGIDPFASDVLLSQIRTQAQIAIDTSDLILLIVDAKAGLTADDVDVADMLRKSGKPVLLVANKIDTVARTTDTIDFLELGIGEPIPVSSVNLMGLGDLLDKILEELKSVPTESDGVEETIKVAVIGRPNAGKSSLVNRLVGENRVMVSDIPGTTRDAIDTEVTANGKRFLLIDTAGIRRRRAVEEGTLERYSVLRAIAAIKRCDVAILVIDAEQGISEQDTKIAGLTLDEGKALVVCINKWDIIEKDTKTLPEYEKKVREALKFAPYAQQLFLSALTGQRIGRVFETALLAYNESMKRVTTGSLNDCLAQAQVSQQPPSQGGRRLKIYYATQPSVQPPTFVIFVNDEKLVHFAYERFLENNLRKTFGFQGTPIRMIFRNRKSDD
ncbi:MAG: ribosome biogenesis GTPase Der [Oscillospiraceae bacterium]|jgi:GTP-binding protein|nr:ribosome biogenesis GTPase Der [Oscillospiraceae bacterium]